MFNLAQIGTLPVMCTELQTVTRNDHIMSKVIHYTRYGWPAKISEDLKPYYHWSNELTIESNCVTWGIHVVVPKRLRAQVLEELHISHMGMNKMKLVARGFVWWPSIDKEIKQLAKSCDACLSVGHAPSLSPLHPWSWPSQPWQRVHVDFAGPLFSKTYLLVVDSYSKWPEIWEVSSTFTTATIKVLRHIFSVFGLPKQLVSDNGPQCTSNEFAIFLCSNNIKHFRSAPFHQATNGAVERLVQTLKNSLKKGKKEGHTSEYTLSNFLLFY